MVAGTTPVLVHNCKTYSNTYGGNQGGIIADVDSDGILNLVIEVGPTTPRGSQMFADALEGVGGPSGLNGVRGTWGQNMPGNLDSFNAAIRGGTSLEDAARATFTGKMAGRNGFASVVFEDLRGMPGQYTNVKATFRR